MVLSFLVPLTYIFPIPHVFPSTVEQVMELLSVAQTYKMDTVLTHIKNYIARQEPPFIPERNCFTYLLSFPDIWSSHRGTTSSAIHIELLEFDF